jgi:hypothetical protein
MSGVVSAPPECLLGVDRDKLYSTFTIPSRSPMTQLCSVRITVKLQLLSMHKVVDISNTLVFFFLITWK